MWNLLKDKLPDNDYHTLLVVGLIFHDPDDAKGVNKMAYEYAYYYDNKFHYLEKLGINRQSDIDERIRSKYTHWAVINDNSDLVPIIGDYLQAFYK